MDYAAYLIKADKHIRMAYHYAETKQLNESIDELLSAMTEMKLAINAIKHAKIRREG
jgi:hypothetical protein